MYDVVAGARVANMTACVARACSTIMREKSAGFSRVQAQSQKSPSIGHFLHVGKLLRGLPAALLTGLQSRRCGAQPLPATAFKATKKNFARFSRRPLFWVHATMRIARITSFPNRNALRKPSHHSRDREPKRHERGELDSRGGGLRERRVDEATTRGVWPSFAVDDAG